MTRDDDRYLTLDERAALARRLNAAMFVSVHVDSAQIPSLEEQPSIRCRMSRPMPKPRVLPQAKMVRTKKNSQEALQLKPFFRTLQCRVRCRRPLRLPSGSLAIRRASSKLRPNPHRFAAFHVLRRSDVPAVLFEAGYISNADDELLLRTPQQRSELLLRLLKRSKPTLRHATPLSGINWLFAQSPNG